MVVVAEAGVWAAGSNPAGPPPPARPRRLWRLRLGGLVLTLAAVGLGVSGTDRPRGGVEMIAAPQRPPPRPPPWVPDRAVRAALADQLALPPYDRPYARWLWLPEAEVDYARVASFAVNLVNRCANVLLLPPVAGGHLVRLDLRLLARDAHDLHDYLGLWEDFQYDPMFCLLITRDNLDLAGKLDPEVAHHLVKVKRAKKVHDEGEYHTERRVVDHPGGDFAYPDGRGTVRNVPPGRYYYDEKVYDRQPVTKTVVVEEAVPLGEALQVEAVVRLDAPHIDPVAFRELQHGAGSLAPVTDLRYFVFRALSQVQDRAESKLYDAVWGGRYYDLRGVRHSDDPEVTDQQLFFHDFLGIAVKDAARNARGLFDRLQSDQRALRFRSGITGKPRVTFFIAHAGARFERSGGAFTLDVKDADVDAGQRAFANLLDPDFRASEGIVLDNKGFPVNVLLNNRGQLQDEVPPDIAADTSVPAPHPKRLQPGIGCLRCHGPFDYWQPHPNDVKALTRGDHGLDLFGDLAAGHDAFSPATVNRLAGLYGGDLEPGLRRARDDFAEAALRAVGVRPNAGDQADAGRWACRETARVYGDYWYELVGVKQALREVGARAPAGREGAAFDYLLPPDARAWNGAFVAEDVRVGALRQGLGVPRSDWAMSYALTMERRRK